jgi:predicted metal-binding protein
MAKIKCVAVIQCEVSREHCSGAQCGISFAERKDHFAGYGSEAIYYLPMTCGGCPGRRVSRLAAHLKKALAKREVTPEEIVVHLASCVVNDNHHAPPCPHLEDIKLILSRQGLTVVEGSMISGTAERRRQSGVYKGRR